MLFDQLRLKDAIVGLAEEPAKVLILIYRLNTKQDPLSFVSMFMSAATPERIARILLDDANLGGGSALKSWVNTDCSWWINTTMEQQAKSHSKARKGI